MDHLYLKIEETLKISYSLYSTTLPSSDWKCTLAAEPNLPKLNAYYLLHPDSSHPKIIILQQLTLNPPRLSHLTRKKTRKKETKVGQSIRIIKWDEQHHSFRRICYIQEALQISWKICVVSYLRWLGCWYKTHLRFLINGSISSLLERHIYWTLRFCPKPC